MNKRVLGQSIEGRPTTANEHQNQLIWEVISKGRSMRALTTIRIQAIPSALNQRLRWILGYQSAMDVLPDFD
ncbi:hypothetical protein [Lactiplantibacillus plantarum]|uniref:Transposase n=2 Tax=Lactiplantibacillus plantarum TaxID=1590 RepID=A0AAW3RHT8_LACPN|nr:hypothetical protein [Lactiplantibacillus plantarum]AOB21386.1 hypothetical protein AVR82_17350 [Lactiplantibacillus plantarum]AOB24710.1 hypothetical protein AVR83_17330 [Lactiplantibacillus plantarum]AOB24747.1 hypothetical protein AVR83_17545 [Lactiplantibacillus plantarum]ERO40750.1 integrase core domain protein [Lactiplantibacillus plantarum WJL]KPN42048.1 hypothetical protein WJL_2599 [Lactiplantibacillus plantarum WJL]